MDEKDQAILRILERKADLSSRSLSKMVSLPTSTVHRRVKKLEEKGVIIGYKALINYEKTSRPIGAYILINLLEVSLTKGHIPKTRIIESLKKFQEIEEITEVQASYFDLIIRARLESLKKLSNLMEELRAIEGIEEVSSAIIIEENFSPPPQTILSRSDQG